MKKNSISVIIIFILLILSFVLSKLGFTLISQIGNGVVIIALLILCLPNIKTMNKTRFTIAMSITITPCLVLLYALFFMDTNTYLLYGSSICILLSFPIGLTIIHFHKRSS
ncbi:hypothetical protein LL033_24925 (plasmid) [Clostridium estertheticum]|uniref:hypothetical protein n=1 Tax=Clostridium estertheticum TaxID=238834 RepID=UPI001C0DE3A0|nr:hypothetical protein [Clostridium estertheticum]MBU3217850.1 hypothetical protein [Clostridium estertheticum]WAG58368.1 hypothetical protein LL033_24925 [Clostridium estertheticum]